MANLMDLDKPEQAVGEEKKEEGIYWNFACSDKNRIFGQPCF
jgi:hypothetical protein